jgi:hypothetical protein
MEYLDFSKELDLDAVSFASEVLFTLELFRRLAKY